jgi:hypothetical protein
MDRRIMTNLATTGTVMYCISLPLRNQAIIDKKDADCQYVHILQQTDSVGMGMMTHSRQGRQRSVCVSSSTYCT